MRPNSGPSSETRLAGSGSGTYSPLELTLPANSDLARKLSPSSPRRHNLLNGRRVFTCRRTRTPAPYADLRPLTQHSPCRQTSAPSHGTHPLRRPPPLARHSPCRRTSAPRTTLTLSADPVTAVAPSSSRSTQKTAPRCVPRVRSRAHRPMSHTFAWRQGTPQTCQGADTLSGCGHTVRVRTH